MSACFFPSFCVFPVLQIGPYTLASNVVLAPMAGISDKPFRLLCRQFGAALTATEMLSATIQLQHPEKGISRGAHRDEAAPRVVQIAGADPDNLAQAARLNVEQGAQIVDINMGCPVKKILKQAAGSALLRDEPLVERILRTVVAAVDVPVTLKIRTGWSPEHRNGVTIARLAEDCGIAAIAVHGRTRVDMFNGSAEYDTIAAIKAAVKIPVFANGDIATPENARDVLAYTQADGVMIGRSARGRPWIFRDIAHFLRTGQHAAALPLARIEAVMLEHLRAIHQFYGPVLGLGYARKHTSWYLESYAGAREFRSQFNALDNASAQFDAIAGFFEQLQANEAAA
jgi:tRNA-dihydrouridine synthase B